MNNRTQLILLATLLLTGFAVRLYKIDNPIADWHSWRQADTSAVTRNFVKFGLDILHPKYDDFTDVSGKGLINPNGYRFVEFPVFNLIHFTFFKIFPIKSLEWWGRMTTILASIVSAVFMFLIVRRRTNPVTGLLAAFFFLFLPYNIYFSRVVLPDPLMVTLFLAALYYHETGHRVLKLAFGAMAVAVKPVAVFFLLPIYLAQIWVVGILVIPFGLWRLWSLRFPEGIPPSLWLLNGDGIRFRPAFFRWIFGERISIEILGKWGLWPLLTGLMNFVTPFGVWIVSALLYLFTFATGNVRHDYYQIPIIPIIAVLLALGTFHLWTVKHRLWLSRVLLVFSLGLLFFLSWYEVRGLYQINNYAIVLAGQAADKLLPGNAIVVAPYNGDTAFLYQTNRRGFPYMPLPIKDLKDRYNAQYYISVNYDDVTHAVMDQYTVMQQTKDFVIVKLDERPDYWQRKNQPK